MDFECHHKRFCQKRLKSVEDFFEWVSLLILQWFYFIDAAKAVVVVNLNIHVVKSIDCI